MSVKSCDLLQELIQNGELAYLTEYVQNLQNRIQILESYAETASPYVSAADIELVRRKFQRTRSIQTIGTMVDLEQGPDEFKEIARIQIPHNGNPRAILTLDILGFLRMDSPLLMFAMDATNGTLLDCTREDPVLIPFPYTTAYPRYYNYDCRREMIDWKTVKDFGRIRTKLTSDLIVENLDIPTVEIVLYMKHKRRYVWRNNDPAQYPPPFFKWTTQTVAWSLDPYENLS